MSQNVRTIQPAMSNAIALKFQEPKSFSELRAYYWALQRMIDTLIDAFNQPFTDVIGDQIEDWNEALRQTQGRIVNTVKTTPTDDLDQKLDILLHWAGECGDSPSERLALIANLMVESQEDAALMLLRLPYLRSASTRQACV